MLREVSIHNMWRDEQGVTVTRTVDITLSLVSLDNKQVGDVSGDVILVACGITAKHFLKSMNGTTRQ